MGSLILGTAQFGMKYGINNSRGQIPKERAFEIFNTVINEGIDTFDTAYSYQQSEKVIGEFLRSSSKRINVISKLPECASNEVEQKFDESLKSLNMRSFYGYLVHSFDHFRENPGIWASLEKLKRKGKVKKIGFSLYYPSELRYLFRNKLKIDIIQVPFSIFDQRFLPFFVEAKKRGIEINVRSVFLQGLLFKEPDTLNSQFIPVKTRLIKLNRLSDQTRIPLAALCLNFAALTEFVDKIVVGIDSLEQMNEILAASKYAAGVNSIFNKLSSLKVFDENIILPTNWKLINS